MQAIALFDAVLPAPLWLRPYHILATGPSSGLIEMVTDTTSLDRLKRRPQYTSLRDHFERAYGPAGTEGFAAAQRIGFLFQKGVLIDSLSLAANLALAAEAAALPADSDAIAAALEAVGLSPSADGSKMPGELSGGMLRRAALAQILAQRKCADREPL